MLDEIRKFSTSPFGKVVFIVVLIAFGAGFWYVGDPGGGGGIWAVRVGDVTIPPQTVQEEYRQELERLRRAGVEIDAEQAQALGVPQGVLARIVGRAVVDAEAQRLGLTASDERLRARIVSDPVFYGGGTGFDREVYSELLRRVGLSERAYEERMRADIAREQYLGAVQSGIAVPQAMAEALYRIVAEQRTARLVAIAAADVEPPAAPDEAALRAWYEAHAGDYAAPEMRAASAVLLRIDALAETVTVTDAEIAAAYEESIDQFTAPEKRTLRQMIVPDEATARRAHERLLRGDSFATVAREEANLPADTLAVGTVGREALLPEVAEVAFALEVGGVGEPVQSLLGWHIVIVDAIAPAEAEPLDAVRDSVRDLVANDKAVAEVVALADSLDDALGGGATLEAAAADLAIPVTRFGPFDRQGRGPDGQPVPGLPEAVVVTAFSTEPGAESLLEDLPEGGSFVLRVDSVTPAAQRPFEDVRTEVARAVAAEARLTAVTAAAESLAQRLRAGADIEQLAAEQGRAVITTEPFRRDGSGAGTTLPTELVTAMFAAEPGAPVLVTAEETAWLGVVSDVIEADPAADPTGMRVLRTSVSETLGNEILDQLVTGLQARHPVAVNQPILDQIF